ncbi:uncharacterized protein LOC111637232 [Centruroides sculpturatus]|uniref:uncharacterized protein LOC111637232 n=1 Tax=Centruroides sculpturatus TaxID=218467 RepID=UPI000C6EB095|nr:uncharacterized protein LOC111637232 [Centruroides sculpturatus]
MKFNTVVSYIDAEILTQVLDILLSPPASERYKLIKEWLISAFVDSETQRTKKLLTEMELGDCKPSQLLCKMRNLADEKIGENFLKTVVQCLPINMRSILSVSSNELSKLAAMADQIWELSPGPTTAQLVPIASGSAHCREPLPALDILQKQISELLLQVATLNEWIYPHARQRNT